MIARLQIQRDIWIALSNISSISKIFFVENNNFETRMHLVIICLTSHIGHTAIESVPTCNLLAAGRFGREREIVQMGKPRLSNTALCFDRESVAMRMAQIDQITQRLDGRVATGKCYQ